MVPVNKGLLTGTVPVNNEILTGTVSETNLFLIGLQYFDIIYYTSAFLKYVNIYCQKCLF